LNTIDITKIDTRYAVLRLKNAQNEAALLSSMVEEGILEPVSGVLRADTAQLVLLDGFKRYRCAQKLGIQNIPFLSLGDDLSIGIIQLIRISNSNSLHILEQARLVDQLKTEAKMTLSEIASRVDRSPSWVSVRLGLLNETSAFTLNEIFSGRLPARSSLYTLRTFTRVKKIPAVEIDKFVKAVSGKSLSTRNIDVLAKGYFQGGKQIRSQIENGDITKTLSQLKEINTHNDAASSELTEQERTILKDLEIAQKYENRLICTKVSEVTHSAFFAEAELITGGITRHLQSYEQAIRRLHDLSKQKKSNLGAPPSRKNEEGNSPIVGARS
jgi:ParB/RepB/Spo0J family partition protein